MVCVSIYLRFLELADVSFSIACPVSVIRLITKACFSTWLDPEDTFFWSCFMQPPFQLSQEAWFKLRIKKDSVASSTRLHIRPQRSCFKRKLQRFWSQPSTRFEMMPFDPLALMAEEGVSRHGCSHGAAALLLSLWRKPSSCALDKIARYC